MDPTYRGSERFEILGVLGDGGMGVVYDAHDRQRRVRVALKTLHTLSPESLLRLKREFRALETVRHPALVAPDELLEEAGHYLLVMERVEGVHFLDWVRPGSGDRPGDLDESRLRDALIQLAEGLSALHTAGVVHRDVKPSNILVTADGRVRILDFGLVTELESAGRSLTNVVGTPGYMAPEQAVSGRVGPAADWYSVGTLLYEALTGELPFTGPPLEVLMRKQSERPPPPSARAKVPPDLDELATDLLHTRPELRPRGRDVLARLGGRAAAASSARFAVPAASTEGALFLGRARELAELAEAFARAGEQGQPQLVLVRGDTGVGKSALVARFADDLRARHPGVLVLSGRCHERESVPFKAVDGVIDALAAHLAALPRLQAIGLMPRHAELLLQLFPVLRRVEAATPTRTERAARDPNELRARAFTALRELFVRLGDRNRTVLVIDDLHWADADSLALLEELVRPPDGPALLLVATARADAPPPALPGLTTLELPPLSQETARELLARLMRATGAERLPDAEAVASDSAGHPLLLHEIVRHVAVNGAPPSGRLHLEDVIWARVQALDELPRRVVELVAVAGRPTAQEVIQRAAELDHAEFDRVVNVLRIGHLVRTEGARPTDAVLAYHDRLREVVLAYLDDVTRRGHHGRLAHALETASRRDAQALAVHWEQVGDLPRAAGYAREAAERAEAMLAFDRAALLWRDALRLGEAPAERAELSRRLGAALALAGHSGQAADVYLEAAAQATADDALELRRLGAEQLFRAGRLDQAIAAVKQVLGSMGLDYPESGARALLSLGLRRARLRLRGTGFRERREAQIPPEELRRLDTVWAVSLGLTAVDLIRGADFQARHQLLALDAGEPSRIARAFATEAGYSASAGTASAARTARLSARAQALAARLQDPQVTAYVTTMTGVTAMLEGRFVEARERCDGAATMWRNDCLGASFETGLADLFAFYSLAHTGELAEMTRRREALLREAQARGDLYSETNLRLGHAHLIWLAADDPAEVFVQSGLASKAWSHAGFQIPHCFDLWGLVQADLYQEDTGSALRRLETQWSMVEGSHLLRSQFVRVVMRHARARVLLAEAARKAGERAALLSRAAGLRQKLAREPAAWSQALALTLLAGEQQLGGRIDAAAASWAQAAKALAGCDLRLIAAVAARRHGELAGGEAGATRVADADARMRELGVRAPARMALVYAPVPPA